MRTNYTDMAVPQLSLAGSRRKPSNVVPTRDTPMRESLASQASSRYLESSRQMDGAKSPPVLSEYQVPKAASYLTQQLQSKLMVGGLPINAATFENNLTFCNPKANGMISRNPYLMEEPQEEDRQPKKQQQKINRPSSLNRWAANRQTQPPSHPAKTQQSIQAPPPPRPPTPKHRIFTPNLLATEQPSHHYIQQQVQNQALLKKLQADQVTFQTRLAALLQSADQYHRSLQSKYSFSIPDYSQEFSQLRTLRTEAEQLNRSLIFELTKLCSV